MATLIKCKWCNEKSPKSEMTCEERVSDKGNKSRTYIHTIKCYEAYLADKEFKRREAEDFDFLYETIKKVHKIPVIPTGFIAMLQDLRNGTVKVGTKTRRYKQGIDFKTIADTYLYCQDSIEWAKTNRQFKGAMQELLYCLAIVSDKVNIVIAQKKKENFAKEISQSKNDNNQASDLVNFENTEVAFKKKQVKNDISYLLD